MVKYPQAIFISMMNNVNAFGWPEFVWVASIGTYCGDIHLPHIQILLHWENVNSWRVVLFAQFKLLQNSGKALSLFCSNFSSALLPSQNSSKTLALLGLYLRRTLQAFNVGTESSERVAKEYRELTE